MQLLLDHGAMMDRPGLAGGNSSLLRGCLRNYHPDAARFLADRGAPLDLETAAAVGNLEVVRRSFETGGNLKPPATRQQLQSGFAWACMCGHEEVALFLLERGADVRDPGDTGGTALHWAAGSGRLELVKLLLQRGAPLEVVNRWGGTVLGHAGHGFEHGPADVNFLPTFETLLAAGAEIRGRWLAWIERVKGRSPEEKARVAELFRRYGATT